MHGRKLGHLSAVYCVLFDRSGRYIFTGADDGLVKIWSTFDMRLLATLRGHSAEITDMAVSFDNCHLASGSCDKIVRVWCLRSKAPAAVLQAHTAMITSVQFCPKPQGSTRYLISTGNDGCVCFWHWNTITNEFGLKPIKFVERSRAGAQMLCSSFSPGGVFLATGNSDHVVRVYLLHATGIDKICELEAHADKVDSICYSNHLNRFVSGSNDGTARIWRYERQEWRATVLNMTAKLNSGTNSNTISHEEKDVRVTMISWSMDDAMVVTAVSDLTIKIWDAYTGTLLRVLEGHEDEVFVLETCPTDARILLSAGHDGKMILWDIYTGTRIKKFFNLIEGQGHGAVFDCKFSPDGHTLAATDSHGHLLLMGFGNNERCKKIPQQLFFHTDYRPLVRDANNYVLDEQTQQAPHVMPPPFLVDIDGNPYPSNIQRLVPGRENHSEANLIPQMAVNADGDNEVVGDRVQENREGPAENQMDDSDTEEEDVDRGDPRANRAPAPVGGAGASRPSIDVMIEQLQREQDNQMGQRAAGPSGSRSNSNVNNARDHDYSLHSPPPLASPPGMRANMQNRVGMRRSGEVEGVRQSLGNVAVRSTQKERDALRMHVTVKPLDSSILKAAEDRRSAFAEEELKSFWAERKKKLLSPQDTSTASVLVNKKRAQKKAASGLRNQNTETLPENVETARNRLTTRALYDTEEEEDEAGTDLEWQSENSSDDYSDWVGDQGSSNLEPPKRRSQRKRKRRRLSSTEEEEVEMLDVDVDILEAEEEEDTDNSDASTTEDSSDEDAKSQPKSSPVKSSRRIAQRKHQKKPEKKYSKKKTSSTEKRPPLQPVDPNTRQPQPAITELDERFRPPDWITTVIPRKAPFVPQMGDEVLYFRQGHEQYLQAVERKKVYEVDPEKNQPWHKIPNLRAHELVKIVGIKWLIIPTRLCCLKLAFIDTATGKLTGKSFTIRYHDMPDVIDFLVLKHHYDISVDRKWRPGCRFRSMIDDQWWLGTIKTQEPLEADYPDSLYQCFNVHWDNGEYEKLSPWDMEPIDPKRKPAQVGGGIDVTQDEYKSLLYVPKKTEWPASGREEDSQRLVEGIGALMQHSVAEPFIAPVDLQQFPTYAYCVPYPIDLSTIKTRLENGFYRRITALQWDVRLIFNNASLFNEAGSRIVTNANALTETLLRFIKSDRKRKKSRTKSSGSSSKVAASGGDRAGPDPEAWLEQSESLLAMLFDCEDSEPFRLPVDPTIYTDYEDIVSCPMDLTTVHTKLATGHYGNPLDLCRDIRLIFQNSKLYNTNKRSRIYSMTLRLSALFEAHVRDIISDWKLNHKSSSRVKESRTKRQTSPPPVPSLGWDILTNTLLSPGLPSTSGLSSQAARSVSAVAPTSSLSVITGAASSSSSAPSSSSTSAEALVSPHVHSLRAAKASSSGTAASIAGTAATARGSQAQNSDQNKDHPNVENGNDSDATIVEGSDGGDTEVCAEETVYSGRNQRVNDNDDVDDDTEEDQGDDDDYKPASKYRQPSSRKGKGKSLVRGNQRIKGKRSVPPRSTSARLKSSFTSDGNSNGSNSSEEEEDISQQKYQTTRTVNSRLLPEENSSCDEQSETSPKNSKRLQKSNGDVTNVRDYGRRNASKHTRLSEKAPEHRKAQSNRSLRLAETSEKGKTLSRSRSANHTASTSERPSRSAKQRKTYYLADSDATDDEPEDLNETNEVVEEEEEDETGEESSEDEESSEKASEDSEDELITETKKNYRAHKKKKKKSVQSASRRSKRKISSDEEDDEDEEEDSEAENNIPPKRSHSRISPPKKRPRKTSTSNTRVIKGKAMVEGRSKSGRSNALQGRETRNRGQQRVTYLDEYYSDDYGDEDEENDANNHSDSDDVSDEEESSRSVKARSVSSRGRVRKMTARARANLRV
ncbi:bromodomain and WD repeat-containing protein 3-like [Elysia marginata]|uniref:Bromodomain and WD repeat-containing protein 3-like n=1 Tax=Elysia marginata TaxID=1093978 RepID=A0AAV4EQS3_9GAST|nr:bromodomain and WD repeat-containing protein 3-like [Elysia marginata]